MGMDAEQTALACLEQSCNRSPRQRAQHMLACPCCTAVAHRIVQPQWYAKRTTPMPALKCHT